MRIAYCVHGYGRGHATRSECILRAFAPEHELLVLAGHHAYDALRDEFPTVEIPCLLFAYGTRGRLSRRATTTRNLPFVLDFLVGGPRRQKVERLLTDFAPDLVISDAEPFGLHAAQHLGIPNISFDHFGVMAHLELDLPPFDRAHAYFDRWFYRLLIGQPDQMIVSSFYTAPVRDPRVRLVRPLLRDEVLAQRPEPGEHLLVYLNKAEQQLTPQVRHALHAVGSPIRLYGLGARPAEGPIDFRPFGGAPFVADLARCRAVVSTAGNQLVGEAAHLGKPMLVMPEDTVEQRLNAREMVKLGLGEQTTFAALTGRRIRAFLDRSHLYTSRLDRASWDGTAEAVRLISSVVPPSASGWRPAGATAGAAA